MRLRHGAALGAILALSLGVLPPAAQPALAQEVSREFSYTVGSRGQIEGDIGAFIEVVEATLADPRGWSLGGEIRFTRVTEGGDFHVWLASPAEVAAAAGYCSATWSCRVGDDVLINDVRWMQGTETFAHRPLSEYRSYVINHEVGHWLELDHVECPGAGEPAPVMQQQSISLDGCASNVWPLPRERELVRNAHVPPAPTTFTPLAPTRIVDSRIGLGLPGPLRAGDPGTFAVAGVGAIPQDVVAVTGNLTLVDQTADGYVTVTSVARAHPATSTLNAPAGDIRANNITARVAAGTLSVVFRAPAGSTAHAVLDITGYFTEDDGGSTFQPLQPGRVLDTRDGNGLEGPFAARTPRSFQVAGRGSIPAEAVAVTGNLTVVDPTDAGYVSLAPAMDELPPPASTLNFSAGDIRANGVTVPLGDGRLSAVYMATSGARAHLVLDVTGYYVPGLAGARFFPLEPARAMDTRTDRGVSGPVASRSWRTLALGGWRSVPVGAVAISGNLTAVRPSEAGYVAMTHAPVDPVRTSTLNVPAGGIVANGVITPMVDRSVAFVYQAPTGETVQIVLDVSGYFE